MRDAIPLGRIAGFPVSVNWSVLVILWLFTWSLASTLPDHRQRVCTPGLLAGRSVWSAGAAGIAVGP